MTTARLLVRLLLALLPVAGLLVATAQPAAACSCTTQRPEDLVAGADTAFVGSLVAVDDAGDHRWYEFEVAEVLLGEAGPRAEVRSNASGASCGLERMRTGASYLVLASEGSASLCGGTAPARPAYVEQVAALTGPPRPPVDQGPAALEPGRDQGSGAAVSPTVLGGGGLLAVAALVTLVVARRSRRG